MKTLSYCLLLLASVAAPVFAAVEEPIDHRFKPASADPVMRLLHDKGLVAAPDTTPADPPLPDQAREETAELRGRAADAVLTALAFIGVRYERGGATATGFDCSGFTRYVFARTGVALPRRVDEQAHAAGLVAVAREALRPGDLVFFNTLKRTFSHVGIYVGDNRFVHAPKPGGEVRTEDLGRSYWRARYTGARRAVAVAVAPPASIDPAVALR